MSPKPVFSMTVSSGCRKCLVGHGGLVAQSCPTLCDPMDCTLPGSSVHGISQARLLEWVAISFSRGSSWPRNYWVSPVLLEKAMATHSSILAWTIPRTDEPGGLPSMGSHRIGHDWSDLAAAAAIVLCFTLSVLEKTQTFLRKSGNESISLPLIRNVS